MSPLGISWTAKDLDNNRKLINSLRITLELFTAFNTNKQLVNTPLNLVIRLSFTIQKKLREFIFANSVKRHICNVKNSRLEHDLATSVNDSLIC